MGVDLFPHFHLEEHDGHGWRPVKLVPFGGGWTEARLAPGLEELTLPPDELGDAGFRVLGDLAVRHFGLKKRRPQRSRGLPKDVSGPLRERFEADRDDALAEIELVEEYGEDLSLGEGWLTADEISQVDWDRPSERGEPTYRALLGATFFAQLERVQALAATHRLRVVHWFTS